MPRSKIDRLAETEAPQGVVARAAPIPEADLTVLATSRPGQPPPFLVALDGVTDPHNLGAIIRIAESAGATGIVLTRHRAAHVTPTVTKAAAGAIEHMPIAVVPGLPAALQELQSRGCGQSGSPAIHHSPCSTSRWPTGRSVWCLARREPDMSRLVRQRCEIVVSIPKMGQTESLERVRGGRSELLRDRASPFGRFALRLPTSKTNSFPTNTLRGIDLPVDDRYNGMRRRRQGSGQPSTGSPKMETGLDN